MPIGKVLITGAAQGIGAAVANRLAADGAAVWALDRNEAALRATCRTSMQPLVVDLTEPGAINAAVAATGGVDVLVSCAGIVPVGDILSCSDEDWDRSFAINTRPVFQTIRAVLPNMLVAGRGSIITIGSVASVTGVADRCAYGASKAALVGLTKSVARDYAAQGIRCNLVCPAGVETPSMAERFDATPDPAATRKGFYGRVPAGRFATPAEIAGLCAYLASDAAAFVNGAVYMIDGGQTM